MIRKPFVLEGAMVVMFVLGFGAGVGTKAEAGCGAAVPPIASDVVTIEARDAACIVEHVGESDANIIAACSPPGNTSAAQAIAVTLMICHASNAMKDAGGG